MKILFNIYPDTEPLFEKLFITKVNKHTVWLFNIHTMFDGTISKRDFYTVED